ncbi:Ent-kaurene oxidase-like protein [Hapsidospora chrysogenum ATCC 11550]|uniref:Ent-kaurene oxidase-like protein n=1 Tax=Hapsidospora chrysogenum (strain ATCC 11550 / CBS 779.69 / DSM 880 / IAM 14645 / JCM 23072 / IMI 49137) TaxID=857340 RepID=A0A086TDB0_HAPC1|nr:Ent-kaurene oxidase-like protein [Hapsidospora chrysogenum ATCC 11550]
MFKIRRNDAEVLIIPRKHVDELRDMPETKLSAMDAHIKNMVAHYTIGNVSLVRDSDLHRRTLQKKLTPALGTLIPSLKDELNYAMQVEIPSCDKDWAGVHINDVTIGIVARISARVFVGPDLCRDTKWLHTSIHFTKSLGMTRNLLRLFPAALRPVAARLLPSYWRIYSNLSAAQRMICPIIRERRAAEASNPDYEKPNDFLQWMMDEARPGEDHPNDIAHRQLLVSLASIHTTSMQVSHFIYDICSHPEYFEPIREEIVSVLREDGGFKKPTLNKLRKMDSFLKESQRLNPPLTMSFQRVVRKTLTLKDGTTFPAGTHFAMASDAISHDPACLPGGGDPEVFDPFRYARLREDKSRPENANRYQFATTDSASLHFGHGIFACPGRFFASNEIKLILCHLLMQYDFKFPDGQSRPDNLCYEEASYPDPTATVLIHKRPVSDPVVARILLG